MRLFLLAAITTLIACPSSSNVTTEVRIHVNIDDSLGALLLRVRVFDTDRALASDQTQSLEGAELPIVVPLFPVVEGERSYHVVMELLGPGGASLGTQRVIGGYVEGESRVLRVRFAQVCSETLCSGRQTCRDESGAAGCVDACFDTQPFDEESLPTPNVCPTTMYVDDAIGVDDPQACFGPEAPCKGIGYVLDEYMSTREGGTINVAGGSTYSGFGFRGDNSGTVSTPTVVQGWPGTERPILEGDGSSAVIGTCCGENAANHLVLDGLEIIGGHLQGILLHGEAVQDAIIRNCVVRGTTLPETVPFQSQAGAIVVTNQVSGVRIIGNVVRDNQGTGEFVVDGERVPLGTIGIAVTGNDIVVEDNLIANNSGYGMFLYADRLRIAQNQILNNGYAGIWMSASDDNVIQDNVICGAATHGIELIDSQRGEIEHNTILRSGGDGILLRDSSNQWTISRNIIAFSGGSGLSRNADEESEPIDLQNLYWMNVAGARGSTEPDGMDWVDVDPMFVDEGACDATLTDGEATRLIDGGPVGARPMDE